MQLNLPVLALCLLGTVFLCDVQGQDGSSTTPDVSTAAPATEPTSADNTGPTSPANTGPTSDAGTEPTSDAGTGPTGPAESTTDSTATEDPSTATTEPVIKEPEGLSDGAIAGIAIGSIAGVAAVGGGIFGALKYTHRI